MSATQTPLALQRTHVKRGRRLTWNDSVALVVIAALLVLGAATPRFFSYDNARAILTSASLVGIAALGLTLMVIVGTSVSLAVSQTASVCAMVFLATQSWGLVGALVAAVAAGAAATAIQGMVVGYGEANPIVLTIAASFALTGIATWATGGLSVAPSGKDYVHLNATPAGIALSVYVLVGLTVVVELALRHTTWGRTLYLTGENRVAARAAGLPVGRTITLAWLGAGGLIAVAAAFSGAFNTTANVNTGGTLTFDAIAAVLAGGTAITGGSGSAVRTLIGAVLIAAVADILLLRGYSTGVQIAVKGLIVLLVVVVIHLRSREGVR
ncbi:sugar ABC transporter permease [Nocardioides szechwanensis]|uniref:Simple sugar transport system permease protein/ribose transport system permease protein/rhamnose transport system permease protein n=1 Tax=Nocardioides szechwanensis TaxID=1005944 RepID=A0A1H0JJS8_9ACTN|nr:ABC transporter permease [Nocardioides szechwanensis]GEP35138.1 sugar ABC transporter permease [Nocardioides szechwanensis]SDO43641.1 simple sugar transport system permease protein/ribose transport system permease protein/rhamnose transport system permease protein [Nocardioides szechwanensis]